MDGRGTIDLASEEEDELAVAVKEWGGVQQVPEGFAGFLVVQQQLDGFFSFVDFLAQSPHGGLVCASALQEATVARDDLVSLKAGDGDEAVRCEDDWVVGLGFIS